MSLTTMQPKTVNEEWSLVNLDQVATPGRLCELDLRQRFLTLPDDVQRLQLMRLGFVPLDATIFP